MIDHDDPPVRGQAIVGRIAVGRGGWYRRRPDHRRFGRPPVLLGTTPRRLGDSSDCERSDGPGQFPEAGVKHAMRSDAIWGPAWIGARLVKLTLIDALP
jgi:hypothetical protein